MHSHFCTNNGCVLEQQECTKHSPTISGRLLFRDECLCKGGRWSTRMLENPQQYQRTQENTRKRKKTQQHARARKRIQDNARESATIHGNPSTTKNENARHRKRMQEKSMTILDNPRECKDNAKENLRQSTTIHDNDRERKRIQERTGECKRTQENAREDMRLQETSRECKRICDNPPQCKRTQENAREWVLPSTISLIMPSHNCNFFVKIQAVTKAIFDIWLVFQPLLNLDFAEVKTVYIYKWKLLPQNHVLAAAKKRVENWKEMSVASISFSKNHNFLTA